MSSWCSNCRANCSSSISSAGMMGGGRRISGRMNDIAFLYPVLDSTWRMGGVSLESRSRMSR
jgi:hypothetical protein